MNRPVVKMESEGGCVVKRFPAVSTQTSRRSRLLRRGYSCLTLMEVVPAQAAKPNLLCAVLRRMIWASTSAIGRVKDFSLIAQACALGRL